MQLPSYQLLPKKARRPLAVVAISLVAIILLVIAFYFLSRPYVEAQLGSVVDQSSGRLVLKVPAKLTRDQQLVPAFFGAEQGEMLVRAAAWSWRDDGSTGKTLDGVRFAMGYSYVVAKGAIPSDRASVVAQIKQSSQASIVSRVQTLADCKETPAIKLYDYHPAGAKGFYYDYSCINHQERKLHGLVGFLLVDDSNELHLIMMIARDDVWWANRSHISEMLNEVTVKK